MSTTVFVSVLALIVVGLAVCVAAVEKGTRRTHPELGDLPAVLLLIAILGFFGYLVDRMRVFHAKMAEVDSAFLGYPAPPTSNERR